MSREGDFRGGKAWFGFHSEAEAPKKRGPGPLAWAVLRDLPSTLEMKEASIVSQVGPRVGQPLTCSWSSASRVALSSSESELSESDELSSLLWLLSVLLLTTGAAGGGGGGGSAGSSGILANRISKTSCGERGRLSEGRRRRRFPKQTDARNGDDAPQGEKREAPPQFPPHPPHPNWNLRISGNTARERPAPGRLARPRRADQLSRGQPQGSHLALIRAGKGGQSWAGGATLILQEPRGKKMQLVGLRTPLPRVLHFQERNSTKNSTSQSSPLPREEDSTSLDGEKNRLGEQRLLE